MRSSVDAALGRPILGRRSMSAWAPHAAPRPHPLRVGLVRRLALRGLLLLAVAELLALALRGSEVLVSGGPAG
ncbi:MAG TPA: hypothetical protein VFO78_01695 [Candidatus Limnocylindrales bacterium]|nr:hypothetical protein [Candidatus Limnocylindrales bacterium]